MFPDTATPMTGQRPLALIQLEKEESPLVNALQKGGFPVEFYRSAHHIPSPVTPERYHVLIVDYRLYGNWEKGPLGTIPVILYIPEPSALTPALALTGRFFGILSGRPRPGELEKVINGCRHNWLKVDRREISFYRLPLIKDYLIKIKNNCARVSEFLKSLYLSPNRIDRLTLREFNLFKIMAFHGGNLHRWADSMGISENTLAKHLKSLRKKLAVNSTEALIDLSVSFFSDSTKDKRNIINHLNDIKANILTLSFLTDFHNGDIFQDMTNRECEIIMGILDHKSNREIAEDLCISVHTVKSHITSVYRKLDVTSRSQLLRRFRD